MDSSTSRELELHLSYRRPDAACHVWARLSVDEIVEQAEFQLALEDAEPVHLAIRLESGASDAAMQLFGEELFRALFCGRLHDLYEQALQREPSQLRIRLVCNDAESARVPWELMYDPVRKHYLSLALPFIRDLATRAPRRPLAGAAPLRILIAEASPHDLPPVSSIWETHTLGAVLAAPEQSGRIHASFIADATIARVQNALREASAMTPPAPYDVVHFIGHAGPVGEEGATALAFLGDDGDAHMVSADAFAAIVNNRTVKLVFLNACETAQLAGMAAAQGLAPALLQAGVPIVIGMQTAVDTQVAQQFSEAFYAAVVDGRPVDEALLDARRLVYAWTGPQPAALAIPVCYMHADSGVLVEPVLPLTRVADAPLSRGPAQQPSRGMWLRRIATAVAATVGFIASLLGIWQGVEWWRASQSLPPMNGDYNIAVADFSTAEMTTEETRIAGRIANALAARVAESIPQLEQAGGDIQVRGPGEIGSINGETQAERVRAAEALAQKEGADLVVFGNLRFEPGQTTLTPEFFLASTRLGNAEEVSGYHAWDAIAVPDNPATNPAAAAVFTATVAQQAGSWIEFVVGLGYTKLHRYVSAIEHLQRATQVTRADGTPFPVQNKALYLFLGAMTTKLAEQQGIDAADHPLLINAREYFSAALALDSTYARALLGMGQLDFLTGRDDCSTPDHTDSAALQRAMTFYARARQAADPSVLDEAAVKASMFDARVLQCWAFERSDLQLLNRANERYRFILDEYDTRALKGDQQRIRTYASESHAGLGLSHYAAYRANPSDGDSLAAALDEFEQAEAMSQEADRLAIIRLWQARVLMHQNACNLAAARIGLAQENAHTYQTENNGLRDVHYQELWDAVRTEMKTLCPTTTLPESS